MLRRSQYGGHRERCHYSIVSLCVCCARWSLVAAECDRGQPRLASVAVIEGRTAEVVTGL
jgi:hypothetical protein